MQDRFKFRAKLKSMDKWIYGAYLKMLPYQPNPIGKIKPLETEYKHLIITEGSADWEMPRGIEAYEVIPETVGQCTGIEDDNHQLVYEGDIVRFHSLAGYATFEIKFNDEFAAFGYEDEETDFCEFGRLFDVSNYIEILGNIYENTELLGVENE